MGPKWSICPEQIFFSKNHFYYFHHPIGPFHCAKFKKNSYSKSRIMAMHYFWTQNGSFALIFFREIITLILIYLLAPFIVQNLKKILPVDPKLWGCAFFGPKMAHFPKWELFLKPCSRALFLLFMPIYIPKIKVRY